MKDKTLSEQLKHWRAMSPSEWTMDEFILGAESIESELKEAIDFAEWMHDLVDWQEGFVEIPWKK
jgi:hypothetical protein|tara:strand:+ start:209 stop:403 length:195 start_codon:yes stop_codon:yes gene_type:complete